MIERFKLNKRSKNVTSIYDGKSIALVYEVQEGYEDLPQMIVNYMNDLTKTESKEDESDNIDIIDYVKIRMEDLDLNPKHLVEVLGCRSMVSKIFNRKRKLTIKMIRALHKKFNIPKDILIYNLLKVNDDEEL